MKNGFPIVGAQFPGAQIIAGSFGCNGASAPTFIAPSRNGKFTVSAPASGLYTVTLTEGPIVGKEIAVFCHLADPTVNSTKRASIFAFTGLSTFGNFVIQTQSTTGTDANLAAPAIVSFWIVISESRALT